MDKCLIHQSQRQICILTVTFTLNYSDCVQTPLCHRLGHKHYSEFISGLSFRRWSLIKFSHQIAIRMDLELLQAVAVLLHTCQQIPHPSSNRYRGFKESPLDTMQPVGVQDQHSSLGTLIYYLQFSIVHKGAECQLVVFQELMKFGILNKIK
jgi:hypothetical protein